MFYLYDTFRCYDENKQPYAFQLEQHTQIQNLHCSVTEEGFLLKSVGNRHILNAPEVRQFAFSMEFRITYLKEFDPIFSVFFFYNQVRREGFGVRIHYRLSGSLQLELIQLQKSMITSLHTLNFSDIQWCEGNSQLLELETDKDLIRCRISGVEAKFPCPDGRGKLALERENFMGELVLKQICFETRETMDSELLLQPTCISIPLTNGGDIPYTLTWQIERIEKELYLTATLDGGTKTRPVNREDRPGQYVAEKDTMTSPYAGIRLGDQEQLFQLSPGENRMIDPNLFWECQKEFFHDTQLPIQGRFLLDIPWNEQIQLIFGYEKLSCSGYSAQQGGQEFRFDPQGTLQYSGQPLDGRTRWEIYSPFDKFAISIIPEDCWHRDEIVHHLKYNHYFEHTETIHFTLELSIGIEPDYLTFRASIVDVFETQTLVSAEPLITDEADMLRAEVSFGAMEVGVYKIRYEVFYGDELYKTMQRVFEVFDKDTDENPAMKTGLPFMFSMPNEQKWLMRGSFDLWSPQVSCDVEHYITCITDTPIEAEIRRPWEVIKLFKRQWFAWLGKRTCKDHESERHAIIRQKADYLFYGMDDGTIDWLDSGSIFPFRADHWNMSRLNNPYQRNLLNQFFEIHPGVAEEIGYHVSEPMTQNTFEKLMTRWGKKWIRYANESLLGLFQEQNGQLAAENPKVRRAMYGPFNPYVTPSLSTHCLPLYGIMDSDSIWRDIYTGFAIFEDYPYSCGYQPYRGAFGIMTLTLHYPNLNIYPEQYSGGMGGCIDGAVKFAHAPMGAYSIRYDQNSTHAFEFVFNTPCRIAEGYRYWNSYGFHRPGLHEAYIDRLVRDWRYALQYKPDKPLRTMAFLAEFDHEEDRFRINQYETRNFFAFTNRSESAMGLVYECSRETGVPNGFALKMETLKQLTAHDCDTLVLPSMKNAEKAHIARIRQLYQDGVNLIALSDVNGLEDLFCVKPESVRTCVHSVEYNQVTQSVYPMEADFQYASAGACVVMTANGSVPAIFRTPRTLLINTDVECLGSEDPRKVNVSSAYHIVGTMLRKALEEQIAEVSDPLVKGKNVGVTLFQAESGKKVLLAIDYSSFDNRDPAPKEAVITVNLPGIQSVKSDRTVLTGSKNDMIRELRFQIAAHEAVFIELFE